MLDLSRNKLGLNDESGAVISHPNGYNVGTDAGVVRGTMNAAVSLFSGGELIGAMLRCRSCPLTTLNLQHNMIRGMGARDMCDSVQYCKTLMHLDISYNDIGSEGAMCLGSALIDNKCVKSLNVGYNRIDPKGAFVLCVGVRESRITQFKIDGNPIGEIGAKSIISLSITKGKRIVDISSNACDIELYGLHELQKDVKSGIVVQKPANTLLQEHKFAQMDVSGMDIDVLCIPCI